MKRACCVGREHVVARRHQVVGAVGHQHRQPRRRPVRSSAIADHRVVDLGWGLVVQPGLARPVSSQWVVLPVTRMSPSVIRGEHQEIRKPPIRRQEQKPVEVVEAKQGAPATAGA